MKIQLIIIGSELLNGKIQDKNAAWLAKFAFKNHFTLDQVHIIPDNEEKFKQVIQLATKEADLVITSGGLGPTLDDLTKKMLSNYFQKTFVFNADALAITQKHYERYQREYDQNKFDYHMLPEGFTPIHNPVGFAPGFQFQYEKHKLIASAPGVPAEFQGMVESEIIPSFLKIAKKQSVYKKHVIVKTWGIPESKIFKVIAPTLWEDLEKIGSVSSLPHLGGVDIGVEIKASTLDDLEVLYDKALKLITDTDLKESIWHIGPESLEEVIIQKANDKNLKIGFAESCTGGLCASRITDISGSSSVFWGSIVSYSNEVKINTLGVNPQTLNSFGAVSLETAKEMAMGARKNLKVDIAVTTTGIAGPNGGSKEKPVGTVGIGFSYKNENSSEMFYFAGNREQLKYRFSQAALFKLLEIINHY
jgi:nicotinamide-nucleotide amidase